ncbi:hypothetical protein Pelo_13930 [Pelomyxa schiedti]|nr:hypothetical protein Pelo_13930 [Pelomyxa schiedti]
MSGADGVSVGVSVGVTGDVATTARSETPNGSVIPAASPSPSPSLVPPASPEYRPRMPTNAPPPIPSEHKRKGSVSVAPDAATLAYADNFLDGFHIIGKKWEADQHWVLAIMKFYAGILEVNQGFLADTNELCMKFRKKSEEQPDSLSKGCVMSVVKTIETISKVQVLMTGVLEKLKADLDKQFHSREIERKKLMCEAAALTKDLQMQLDTLHKTRSIFVKASREAASDKVALEKKKLDPNVKPAVLTAAEQKCTASAEKAKAADQKYQEVLQHTNLKQSNHYTIDQPALLKKFEQFQRSTVISIKEMCAIFSERFRETPMIYAWETSLKDMSEVLEKMDATAEILDYVARKGTRMKPPEPIQYRNADDVAIDVVVPKVHQAVRNTNSPTLATSPKTTAWCKVKPSSRSGSAGSSGGSSGGSLTLGETRYEHTPNSLQLGGSKGSLQADDEEIGSVTSEVLDPPEQDPTSEESKLAKIMLELESQVQTDLLKSDAENEALQSNLSKSAMAPLDLANQLLELTGMTDLTHFDIEIPSGSDPTTQLKLQSQPQQPTTEEGKS